MFLTVFDAESSLGLVRLYFEELCALLAARRSRRCSSARPDAPRADRFEQDLNRNLAILFGRAPRGPDGESSISLA